MASINTNWKRVIWIAIAWTMISALQLSYEYAILLDYGYLPSWATQGQFWVYTISYCLTFFVIGLVAGAFIVFILMRWFRSLPYGRALLYATASFIVMFFLSTVFQMTFQIAINVEMDRILPELGRSLEQYFFSTDFVKYVFFWLIVLLLTIISLFVSDKYGPGVLQKFLIGKYFHPRKEERVFMFLDLKGSTTIAEKLGEHRYFNFLKDVIADITSPILNAQGEIYQYVGDEIVISWSLKEGLKNANCIQGFSSVQELLENKREYYHREYEVQPVFKAGIHCGNIVAGEMGVVKREITFSGDVLNTAARIQGRCNEFESQLLVSEELLKLIPEQERKFKFENVGHVSLRGKQKAIQLYDINFE